MTSSFLKALYNGDIAPWEQSGDMPPKQVAIGEAYLKVESSLLELLTEEQKQIYDEMMRLQGDWSDIEKEEAYVSGFKAGMRICAECLL